MEFCFTTVLMNNITVDSDVPAMKVAGVCICICMHNSDAGRVGAPQVHSIPKYDMYQYDNNSNVISIVRV